MPDLHIQAIQLISETSFRSFHEVEFILTELQTAPNSRDISSLDELLARYMEFPQVRELYNNSQ